MEPIIDRRELRLCRGSCKAPWALEAWVERLPPVLCGILAAVTEPDTVVGRPGAGEVSCPVLAPCCLFALRERGVAFHRLVTRRAVYVCQEGTQDAPGGWAQCRLAERPLFHDARA